MDLRYEKFCREHFDLWEKHLLKNPNVMKFVYSYETGIKKMPYYLEHWSKHGFGWYSIFSGNEFVGRIGLFWNHFQPSRVELGYTIREEYWGKGIATTASSYVITDFFKLGISNEIVATIENQNPASIRVAEKLGFKMDGESDIFIEGNPHPLKLYRLTTKRPFEIVQSIVHKMQSCGLGMKRKSVSLCSYNPDWDLAFKWIQEKISNQLDQFKNQYKIEHFGSTSIQGIIAKPALDVMLVFEDLQRLLQSIEPLEQLGFIYKGDAVSNVQQSTADPKRHFFSFYDLNEEIDYIHLHALTEDHPDVTRNLRFRDQLRLNPILAKEYQSLKERLQLSSLARHEYTRAKDTFIEKVVTGKAR